MATVRFRVKGKKSPANILVRLKQGDQFDYEISTGLQTRLEHWSTSKQKVKNIQTATYKDFVNGKLNELRTFIENEYLAMLPMGEEVSQKWLKDNVNDFFNRSNSSLNDSGVYLSSFIERFIEESKDKINPRTGKKLTERTLGDYKAFKKKLKEYEEFYGKRVKLRRIDLDFHESFVNFLANKQFLNPNTIGFYISKLELFCKAADKKGVKVHQAYKSSDFYAPSNKTEDIYLNPDEIDAVFNLELPLNGKLDNARDWLIIGVWTGLRVGDLLGLEEQNIDGSFIHITNKKTAIPVIIPLHEQVKATLEKRERKFPRRISDQKFNKYIKDVCEKAELNEEVKGSMMVEKKIKDKSIYRKTADNYPKHKLVSSHICRRSFATNHYGKLDTLTIMKITGHKTEKQFLEYIKITPKEHAVKLKEFWNKNRKNEQK